MIEGEIMKKDVHVILGSESDNAYGNILLPIFLEMGVTYGVSYASCHRHNGILSPTVRGIEEDIIVFLGGMSLAAPGIIRSILTTSGIFDKVVFGIPTDASARSAIEDLPEGTPVQTCGLNTVSVTHSIKNSGLAIVHMIATFRKEGTIIEKLAKWYYDFVVRKPFVSEVKLVNGLIPIPEKKKEA
jgi:phosphoribosylcarboxyaminoimidazole (NCAIR) mutase